MIDSIVGCVQVLGLHDREPNKAGEEAAIARSNICLKLHIIMCNHLHMATNLAIDDSLLERALKAGGHRTKKATVTEALEEYIQRRKQAKVVRLFGKIDLDKDYDYKEQRRRV